MSVRTTADEKVDEAKASIAKATEAMHDVVETDIWGWSDYTIEAKDKFIKALKKLRKLRQLLE